MIQIDKSDFLYKALQNLGVNEEYIEEEYLSFAKSGISNSKDFNNHLQAKLGMDFVGEVDELQLEEVVDYYADLKHHKCPAKSKVTGMLKQYKQNPNDNIRTEIINSQLKEVLLIACAYKLRRQEINLSDLVQVCNIGLMTAVEKYKVSSKLPFEIYLNYWILDAISKEYNIGEQNNG